MTRAEKITALAARHAQDLLAMRLCAPPATEPEREVMLRFLTEAFDELGVEQALWPFTHEDLCRSNTCHVQGDASPVFGRNRALLLLGDFNRAKATLATLRAVKDEAKLP